MLRASTMLLIYVACLFWLGNVPCLAANCTVLRASLLYATPVGPLPPESVLICSMLVLTIFALVSLM